MGKGSKPRPIDIERKVFEDNWDRIFNKASKEVREEVKSAVDDFNNQFDGVAEALDDMAANQED